MFVIFKRSFKMAMSNFMNEIYNGGFAPEFSISMLKEIIAYSKVHGSPVLKAFIFQSF